MSALHLCRRSCLGGACRKATRHLGWIATSESDLRVECSYISSLGLPRLITSIPIFAECISIPQRVLRTPQKNQNDWKSEWLKGVRFLGLKYNILSRLPICCACAWPAPCGPLNCSRSRTTDQWPMSSSGR